MIEPLRSSSAPPSWKVKPILANDSHQAKQPGLSAFLDRLRQLDCVTGIETLQYHPALIVRTDFVANPSEPSSIEGWFSTLDELGATRFEVRTTASTPVQQRQVLALLRQHLLGR